MQFAAPRLVSQIGPHGWWWGRSLWGRKAWSEANTAGRLRSHLQHLSNTQRMARSHETNALAWWWLDDFRKSLHYKTLFFKSIKSDVSLKTVWCPFQRADSGCITCTEGIWWIEVDGKFMADLQSQATVNLQVMLIQGWALIRNRQKPWEKAAEAVTCQVGGSLAPKPNAGNILSLCKESECQLKITFP